MSYFEMFTNEVVCLIVCFYIRISEVIDTHIPIKQLSRQELKSRSKPWITSGIRTSIRIKNGLFTKFLKTKSTYYHARFKFYRNKLNHFIYLSKRSYYNNFFSIHVHVNNGKRIWQGIKSGCQRKPDKMLKMSTEGGQQNKFILTS